MPSTTKLTRQRASNFNEVLERYWGLWDELFAKAQEADEFQFILNLLRIRGASDPGWDAWQNTIDAIRSVAKLVKKTDGTRRLNLLLWTYGHIVEASDHYEIVMNMANVAGGEQYRAWNFLGKSGGRRRELSPSEKIAEIQKRCKALGLKDYSTPLSEALDKELRNAVYHSDYSAHMGKVRFRASNGLHTEYDVERTNDVISRAIAMHKAIKDLFRAYTASYDNPRTIDCTYGFEGQKAQIIVRKKHGVMALEKSPMGPGGFAIGTYKPGEKAKIAEGQYLLPASVGDELNKVLEYLPGPIARKIVKLYMRLYKNSQH